MRQTDSNQKEMTVEGTHDTSQEGSGTVSGPTSWFRKFLVALELTENDAGVLQVLAPLVNTFDTQLVIVHVITTGTSVAGNALDGSPANEQEKAKLTDMRARVESAGLRRARSVEFQILHGDPSERLVEYAEFCHCDLLVLGSHHRGVLGRLVRGSVSTDVVTRSRRSVLVVGDPLEGSTQ